MEELEEETRPGGKNLRKVRAARLRRVSLSPSLRPSLCGPPSLWSASARLELEVGGSSGSRARPPAPLHGDEAFVRALCFF